MDNSSETTIRAILNCLESFQTHPERFPLELREKFCACSFSLAGGTREAPRQESSEFRFLETESISNTTNTITRDASLASIRRHRHPKTHSSTHRKISRKCVSETEQPD